MVEDGSGLLAPLSHLPSRSPKPGQEEASRGRAAAGSVPCILHMRMETVQVPLVALMWVTRVS